MKRILTILLLLLATSVFAQQNPVQLILGSNGVLTNTFNPAATMNLTQTTTSNANALGGIAASNFITNNAAGITLNGTLSGDGSGLTSLNRTNFSTCPAFQTFHDDSADPHQAWTNGVLYTMSWKTASVSGGVVWNSAGNFASNFPVGWVMFTQFEYSICNNSGSYLQWVIQIAKNGVNFEYPCRKYMDLTGNTAAPFDLARVCQVTYNDSPTNRYSVQFQQYNANGYTLTNIWAGFTGTYLGY